MGDAELASILRSERAAAVRTRLVEAVEGPTGKRKKTKRKEEEFLLGREETRWLCCCTKRGCREDFSGTNSSQGSVLVVREEARGNYEASQAHLHPSSTS